jgi:hypothetical protein
LTIKAGWWHGVTTNNKEKDRQMKTTTFKIMGKTLAIYGYRPRVSKNRFGIGKGSTFMGLHFGKQSHYLSLPALANRRFGGVQDITNVA